MIEQVKKLIELGWFLYLIVLSLFFLLDFFTYVDIFHFSKTSFVEVYLGSIDLVSANFFMIIALLPYIVILVIIAIVYLGNFPLLKLLKEESLKKKAIGLNQPLKKSKSLIDSKKFYYLLLVMFIFLLPIGYIIFKSIIIPLSLIFLMCMLLLLDVVNKKISEQNKLNLILFYILLSLIFTSLLYIGYSVFLKVIEFMDITYIPPIFFGILYLLVLLSFYGSLSYICKSNNASYNISLKKLIGSPTFLSIFLLVPTIIAYCISIETKESSFILYSFFGSFIQFINIAVLNMMMETNNKRDLDNQKKIKVFSSILLLFFLVLITFFHNHNIETWKDINSKENTSANIFLTNYLLSNNHINFYVNTFNYDNNETEQRCKTKENILAFEANSKDLKYLSISKNMKLFFNEKDKNLTCIYAIEEKDDKYKLKDIGYIK